MAQQMDAERKSGQRMLRAAYHVATEAIFGSGQSWRSTKIWNILSALSCLGESPASPDACLVEVQVVNRDIGSLLLASRQGAN